MPQFSLSLKRHAIAAFAVAALLLAPSSYAAPKNLSDVQREIAKRHDQSVAELQKWIALPSIAAENLNFPAGAEYMAQLARDAGFQPATVINTDTLWTDTLFGLFGVAPSVVGDAG